MQQIRQALKRKQAQVAQLNKEIALLEQAEEKLREIAPLLAEADEDDGSLLAEEEEIAQPIAAKAATASSVPAAAVQPDPQKPVALRWP